MSAIELVLLLHLIGAGVLIGLTVCSIVILLKKPAQSVNIQYVRYLRGVGPFAAAWQLLTGLILFLHEPDHFQHNRLFWLKIAFYLADGAIAEVIIQQKMTRAIQGNAAAETSSLVIWTTLSALMIGAIVVIGYWLVIR